jgi:D-alanyl-D-alanine carboxypeptidase
MGAQRFLSSIRTMLCLGLVLLAGACRSSNPGRPTASSHPALSSSAPSAAGPGAIPQLPSDLTLLAAVGKNRSLAAGYVPPDLTLIPPEFVSSLEPQRLRKPAADALVTMLTDARNQGLNVKVNSAYRSYDYQATNLRAEIAAFGCAQALNQVAAPGHSEHQLGLAADLTAADVGWDLQDKFGETPEGRWLMAHAPTYGFVLSYPKNMEAITGFIYEPWHFRYLTPQVAQAVVVSGKTSSEYLQGLGKAADAGVEATPSTPPRGFGCGS